MGVYVGFWWRPGGHGDRVGARSPCWHPRKVSNLQPSANRRVPYQLSYVGLSFAVHFVHRSCLCSQTRKGLGFTR